MDINDDNRNVIDKYKGWEIDLIKEDLIKRRLPYAVAMQHINGDFNFSTVVRNANAFGASETFYICGKKKWDTRGDVGTRHYSVVKFIKTLDDLKKLKEKYVFVGLENNVERNCVNIKDFSWPKNSLIIIGEENSGIVPEILDMCDHFVYIDMLGSVRSINAGCASAVAMFDYMNKYTE